MKFVLKLALMVLMIAGMFVFYLSFPGAGISRAKQTTGVVVEKRTEARVFQEVCYVVISLCDGGTRRKKFPCGEWANVAVGDEWPTMAVVDCD